MTLWRNSSGVPGVRVRLAGPPGNPLGIGVQLRAVSGATRGPVREIHAGSGYWSMGAATVVLARSASTTGVAVRWPGGVEQLVRLQPGQRDLVISASAGAGR